MARFELARRNIAPGQSDEEVGKVQRYLTRFGYLSGPFTRTTLDEATQKSLLSFQAFAGLPETGVVDPATADALEQPRCGVPDGTPGATPTASTAEPFVLRGCDYEADFRTLTYAFVRGTLDLAGAAERDPVRAAFATWQREIPIDFQEVGVANGPNFTVGWFVAAHGDGSPFDGIGNTLAHAFFPPPCGGTHAGKLHFDDAEPWALGHGTGAFDTQTVALHEIGHLLGLSHSSVPGAVMNPFYPGMRRSLSADDVAGAQAMYGRRGPSLVVLTHLENIGDVVGRENEFVGTRGESRRLEGFAVELSPPVPGLGLRYMAHLQGIGDVPFVDGGQFVGTRGESRRLEGFAIELTGPAAGNFDVRYMAHLQGIGDTGFSENGQFCGTRGESRRVEGILVRVEPR